MSPPRLHVGGIAAADEVVVLRFRLTAPLHEHLRQCAHHLGVPLAWVVRDALNDYLGTDYPHPLPGPNRRADADEGR